MDQITPYNLSSNSYYFSPTGLIITNGLTYDQWYGIGQQLGTIIEWSQFAVGDWINYGEARYGEKYAQALGLIPRDLKTLQNWVWVSKGVPLHVRVSGVSWSHHRAVASLSEDRQVKYLNMVSKAESYVSVKRLEEAISNEDKATQSALAEQGIPPSPPKPPPPATPDDERFEMETENYHLKQQVALQQAELDLLRAKPAGGSVVFEMLGESKIGWRLEGGESGVIEAPAEVVRLLVVKLGLGEI